MRSGSASRFHDHDKKLAKLIIFLQNEKFSKKMEDISYSLLCGTVTKTLICVNSFLQIELNTDLIDGEKLKNGKCGTLNSTDCCISAFNRCACAFLSLRSMTTFTSRQEINRCRTLKT